MQLAGAVALVTDGAGGLGLATVDRARELGPLRVAVSCAGIGTPGRVLARAA